MRTHSIGLLACVAIAAASAGVTTAQDEVSGWTLKKALKQIDKATKDLHGVTAEVHYEELYKNRKIAGSGTFYVSFDGKVRAEIGGGVPRTFLVVPPSLHTYRPLEETVETYYLPSNPDLLAQYALLGFVPAGSALKKQYDLTLTEESNLDGHKVLLFELAPRSKEVARVITTIRLWIDQETWLPVQQFVHHTSSGIQVTVRYLELTRNDNLSDELFRPDWPAGTKTVTQ